MAKRFDGTAPDVLPMGPLSARPQACEEGRMYYITDAGVQRWTRYDGSAWSDIVPHWSQVIGLADAIGAGGVPIGDYGLILVAAGPSEDWGSLT